MSPFKGRTVIEIMVLTFTFVVAFTIVSVGLSVTFVEIRDPDADTSGATDVLFTAVTIIIGALLGMLTVKGTDSVVRDLSKRDNVPEDEPEDVLSEDDEPKIEE